MARSRTPEEDLDMHVPCRSQSALLAAVLLAAPAVAQTTPPPVPTLPPQPAPKGIQWINGDYTWKLGGYVKVDLIHDFDEIGSTDSFDPRTIPTSGADGDYSATRIHARESRLNLDVSGPSSAGPFRAYVEGDFFSDQNGFRLRHAYGTVGGVLGGQTWTTFMDEAAMPSTLDFESPIAFPLVRQAQLRWTQALEDGSYWAVALEDPDSDIIVPTGVMGTAEEPLPDLTGRYHWKNERGHVQLSGFSGMARFDPDTGSPDDVFLWGFNLSTKLATVGDDSAIVQVTYGDGVGRYRGGTTAVPDANGDLEAVEVLAALVAYQHHWSEEYRSTVAYSWGEGDLPAGSPPTGTDELQYLAANLIWQFSDRAWAGIEYLFGSRDTFDDEDGTANRVQVALRFDL
jgi:hypothetical protein